MRVMDFLDLLLGVGPHRESPRCGASVVRPINQLSGNTRVLSAPPSLARGS
jgi:hypothetical protein